MVDLVNNPPALPNATGGNSIESLRQFDQDLVVALVRELTAHAQRLNVAITTDQVSAYSRTLLLLTTLGDWQTALGIGPTNIRVFNANTTFPVVTNPNVKILVRCRAGGGAGGGGDTHNRWGGGGGQGATAFKLTTAGALSGQAVTVGPGGAVVGAGVEANGGNGGISSIGAIVLANGGIGGNRSGVGGVGGPGGVGGTGDYFDHGIAGSVGETSDGTLAIASVGGGPGGGNVGTPGAPNSGGGGGGGWLTVPSGGGGSGQIVCTEYGVI